MKTERLLEDNRLLEDETTMPYTHTNGDVTFGVWWMGENDDRYRVTYQPADGRVIAVMLLRHGAYIVDVVAVNPKLLGRATSSAEVARRLTGFEGQMRQPGSLTWARVRLKAA